MHRTIFTTPVVNTLLRGLSLTILKLTGWRVEGSLPPDCPKCVVIAAPHTSNWDLPNTLIAGFALRMNLYWMGKRSIFAPPFGALMRWLGGIAVNREKSTNLVAASVAAHPGRRWPAAAGGAARRHTQQGTLLEDGLLSHRPRRRRADRAVLHGLRPQDLGPGPGVPPDRRHRS
jgi:1-acyl-sn-glycerol-3-phosphate acyltransferase